MKKIEMNNEFKIFFAFDFKEEKGLVAGQQQIWMLFNQQTFCASNQIEVVLTKVLIDQPYLGGNNKTHFLFHQPKFDF